MRPLERRVMKVEKAMGGLPCDNPEHRALTVFVYGVTPEQDAGNDGLRESLRQCPRCSKSTDVVSLVIERPDWYRGLEHEVEQAENSDVIVQIKTLATPERMGGSNQEQPKPALDFDNPPQFSINLAAWLKEIQ